MADRGSQIILGLEDIEAGTHVTIYDEIWKEEEDFLFVKEDRFVFVPKSHQVLISFKARNLRLNYALLT